MSVAIAVPCYWLIVDFPSSKRCTFLTESEKQIVATRIERDRADAVPDSMTLAKLGKYCLDIKSWQMALNFGCSTLGSYAISYFAPRIIQSLGIARSVRDVYLLFM